jgi:hypothetical protein
MKLSKQRLLAGSRFDLLLRFLAIWGFIQTSDGRGLALQRMRRPVLSMRQRFM